MYEIARMAGFFAAHGIWSVSDGATLIPMLGHMNADGTQGMDRLIVDDAATAGRDALEAGKDGRVRAVLVLDAYLRLETGRTDALIIDAVEYGPVRQTVRMAVPYRSASEGFGVYRPKFVEVTGIDEPDYAAMAEDFFDGVDSHEKAAEIWKAHLIDQSV